MEKLFDYILNTWVQYPEKLIEALKQDGYDLSGFEVYEAPTDFCICLRNRKTGEIFDMYFNEDGQKDWKPYYLLIDGWGEIFPTNSIQEAIDKYDPECRVIDTQED